MAAGKTAGNTNPNPNSKPSPINPNWEMLKQTLQPRRPSKHAAAAGTLAPSILGKRKVREESDILPDTPSSTSLLPTSEDCSLTNEVAMDCEMVGVSSEGTKSALGRVTLVNALGNVVYDEYVRPVERIVDYRTKISGIRPKNMKKAKEFWAVQKKVAELITGRVLVGHALHNDLKVLLLSHPKKDIRDTSKYEPFLRKGRSKALRHLADEVLGVKIQQQEHCPIEDARAAMFIYNKHKREWEKSIKAQFRFRKKLKNKKNKPAEEK